MKAITSPVLSLDKPFSTMWNLLVKYKSPLQRCLLILILPVFVIQISPRAFGLSATQQSLFNSGVYYFDAAYTDCSAVSTLQGNDNIQQAFNYFVTKGFTANQSAGIVGNLIQESGVNPLRDQMNNGPGRGIAQWEYYPPPDKGRWNVLLEYAASRGDPRSLAIQLDFIMAEFNSKNYSSVMNDIKSSTTVKDATDIFLAGYEKASVANEASRVDNANGVIALYGSSSTSSLSAVQNGCASACLLDTSSSTSSLSNVRTNVVCLAEQELALWTPTYDRQNYLKYTQNAPEEWCADFVSWIYNQAGYPLGTKLRWRYASVFEIKQIGDNNINFHYHDSNSYTPQPGDLAIHSTSNNPYYHVNMVVDVNTASKTLTLIGGDQGSGPYGGSASQSVVSTETTIGYSSGDITGYVSPD